MKQWLKLTTKQFDGGYIRLLYLKFMCMQFVQQFIKRERFVLLCLWDFFLLTVLHKLPPAQKLEPLLISYILRIIRSNLCVCLQNFRRISIKHKIISSNYLQTTVQCMCNTVSSSSIKLCSVAFILIALLSRTLTTDCNTIVRPPWTPSLGVMYFNFTPLKVGSSSHTVLALTVRGLKHLWSLCLACHLVAILYVS